MRILITGSKGQLGSELKKVILSGEAQIDSIPEEYAGANVTYADSKALNICDIDQVNSIFDLNHYDLCINCAAFTNVDACESQEELAYSVNAEGPYNLARACDNHGAKLVQISTDYVFSGNEPGERVESDATEPISAYGRTKLAGERLAMSANPKTFVLRTAWLYGSEGHNFVRTMLRLAEAGKPVTVVNDQYGNPTSANDLAYVILRLALTDEYGTYHCTNNGTCSWFDLSKTVFELGGYDTSLVTPCSTEEYSSNHPDAAKRPTFSSLRNRHLDHTIGDPMREWDEALSNFLHVR